MVALEGIDLAGKTSAIDLLVPKLARSCRVPVTNCGELRSPIATTLVEMLITGASPFVKTYMFAADRAWTYEHIFLPAFNQGSLILWDRYVDSALAYRAAELDRSKAPIEMDFVMAINQPFLEPDITIYIDIDVDTSIQRGKQIDDRSPYGREILESVRKKYELLGSKKNYRFVDGKQPLPELVLDIYKVIEKEFPELFI